jgi:hypothetical protein
VLPRLGVVGTPPAAPFGPLELTISLMSMVKRERADRLGSYTARREGDYRESSTLGSGVRPTVQVRMGNLVLCLEFGVVSRGRAFGRLSAVIELKFVRQDRGGSNTAQKWVGTEGQEEIT